MGISEHHRKTPSAFPILTGCRHQHEKSDNSTMWKDTLTNGDGMYF